MIKPGGSAVDLWFAYNKRWKQGHLTHWTRANGVVHCEMTILAALPK